MNDDRFFTHRVILRAQLLIRVVLVVSVFIVFQPAGTLAGSGVGIGDKVPNFVLEDADENRHELEEMRGKAIILVMGPRSTSENNDNWVEMLLLAFSKEDSVGIFSVLDMRGIPFFISQGFVRGKAKEKQEQHPVTLLLDWDQKVNKLLGAEKDSTDVFLIAPDGVLANHQLGTYHDEKLKLLNHKLLGILGVDSLKSGEIQQEKD